MGDEITSHAPSIPLNPLRHLDCRVYPKTLPMKTKSNRGPGQPKKGNVRFTAHITPATHKQILSRQKPGMTLGQVIDSAFETTQKV